METAIGNENWGEDAELGVQMYQVALAKLGPGAGHLIVKCPLKKSPVLQSPNLEDTSLPLRMPAAQQRERAGVAIFCL